MQNIAFDYNYPLNIAFKKVARPVESWDEEIVTNAKYIRSQTDKPIVVALSGGIDSEVVCRAFLKAEIDFTVLTVRYKDKINQHDFVYAENFCKKFNIKQTFVEVDRFVLYGKEVENCISQGYIANNIFRYLQLFLLKTIDAMGGCAVLGGGEHLYKHVNGMVNLRYPEDFLMVLEWIKNNNTLHFPYFFQTTPEIMASYLDHELVKLLTANPKYYHCPEYHGFSPEKILIYHAAFPDMERRRKFNGFENFWQYKRDQQKILIEKHPQAVIFKPVSDIRSELGI